LFNHPQFSDPETNFSSGNFGGIRSTVNNSSNGGGPADSRIIQLALKMFF